MCSTSYISPGSPPACVAPLRSAHAAMRACRLCRSVTGGPRADGACGACMGHGALARPHEGLGWHAPRCAHVRCCTCLCACAPAPIWACPQRRRQRACLPSQLHATRDHRPARQPAPTCLPASTTRAQTNTHAHAHARTDPFACARTSFSPPTGEHAPAAPRALASKLAQAAWAVGYQQASRVELAARGAG